MKTIEFDGDRRVKRSELYTGNASYIVIRELREESMYAAMFGKAKPRQSDHAAFTIDQVDRNLLWTELVAERKRELTQRRLRSEIADAIAPERTFSLTSHTDLVREMRSGLVIVCFRRESILGVKSIPRTLISLKR